jgi:hypothetical protein
MHGISHIKKHLNTLEMEKERREEKGLNQK